MRNCKCGATPHHCDEKNNIGVGVMKHQESQQPSGETARSGGKEVGSGSDGGSSLVPCAESVMQQSLGNQQVNGGQLMGQDQYNNNYVLVPVNYITAWNGQTLMQPLLFGENPFMASLSYCHNDNTFVNNTHSATATTTLDILKPLETELTSTSLEATLGSKESVKMERKRGTRRNMKLQRCRSRSRSRMNLGKLLKQLTMLRQQRRSFSRTMEKTITRRLKTQSIMVKKKVQVLRDLLSNQRK